MSASQAATPVYREFQDWVVGCDNIAHCEAYGGSAANDIQISLSRDAGPDGSILLRLDAPDSLDLDHLLLDGKVLRLSPEGWKKAQEGPSGPIALETRNVDTVLSFLDAVRNGSELAHSQGEMHDSGSLAGLNASLLFMDDRQGRMGTRTALLRRGDRPVSAVPQAEPLPHLPPVTAAPRALGDAEMAALIRATRKLDYRSHSDCDDLGEGGQDFARALTDTEALIFIECFRGASQSSFLVFRTRRGEPSHASRLRLPLPIKLDTPDGNNDFQDVFFDPDYSPKTGLFSQSARGPSAGCGDSEEWRFDGREFHLARMAYRQSCNQAAPGSWPTLWQTQDDHIGQ